MFKKFFKLISLKLLTGFLIAIGLVGGVYLALAFTNPTAGPGTVGVVATDTGLLKTFLNGLIGPAGTLTLGIDDVLTDTGSILTKVDTLNNSSSDSDLALIAGTTYLSNCGSSKCCAQKVVTAAGYITTSVINSGKICDSGKLCNSAGSCESTAYTALYNSDHTSLDCASAGGTNVDNGAGVSFCRFNSSACPSGWTSYLNWTTTVATSQNTCNTASGYTACGYCAGAGGCTTTGSHTWSNTEREGCNLYCIYGFGEGDYWVQNYVTPATQIGCY